jgi:lysophospholipase L1-like esterase
VKTKTYLALGDSMSIDLYTGVPGGGAVTQLFKRLQARNGEEWRLIDETRDGCTMAGVPLTRRPEGIDLVTVTIAGNDLLQNMQRPDAVEYLPEFQQSYRRLMGGLQKLARNGKQAVVVVGNIYHPQAEYGPLLDAGLGFVNAFIGDTVVRYGFRLADIYGAFRGHEQEYLCMGIEPTLKGATVIADLFAKAFQLDGNRVAGV